jgi:hypothetical protein
MQHTIRRAVALTVAVGALVAAGAGLAYADSDDDSPAQSAGPGGGSGLSGGPTHTQVLRGVPSVPLSDPTLGEGTVLPPVYNAIG